MVESFKHRQNIVDNKLNTTYRHCQQKLFVICKLKVLSVADRLCLEASWSLSSFHYPPLLHLLLHHADSLQLPQICTDSNITRLSTLTDLKVAAVVQSKALSAAHDPEHPLNRCVTLLQSCCRCTSWGLFLSYLDKFAQQFLYEPML